MLRNWRKESGMSLQQLADKIGVSFTYVAKIEREEQPPPTEKRLHRIAKVLRRSKNEVWNAAGRLPSNVIQMAQRQPSRYAKLVRGTQNLSPQELDRVIKRALAEVQKILREKKESKRQRVSGGQ
jgi:HTH-type transcriptional regulator, competence development regulator